MYETFQLTVNKLETDTAAVSVSPIKVRNLTILAVPTQIQQRKTVIGDSSLVFDYANINHFGLTANLIWQAIPTSLLRVLISFFWL